MNSVKYEITFLEEDLSIEVNAKGEDIEVRTINSGWHTCYCDSEWEAINSLSLELNSRFIITEIKKFEGMKKVSETLFDEKNSIYEIQCR